MNKIVMIYTVGESYDIFSDERTYTVPLMYKSVLDAEVDFWNMVSVISEKQKQSEKDFNNWSNRLASANTIEKKIEILNEKPKEVETMFTFAGERFDAEDFLIDDEDSEKDQKKYREPMFLTVEDWFKK